MEFLVFFAGDTRRKRGRRARRFGREAARGIYPSHKRDGRVMDK
jgi:hypothetical protein